MPMRQLRDHGYTVVSKATAADILVTQMSSSVSKNCKIAARLVGARVVSPAFFQEKTGNVAPAFVKYAAAVAMRRLWLYFDQSLQSSGAIAMRDIRVAADMPFSRWTLLHHKSSLQGSLQSRPTQCFEIITDEAYNAIPKQVLQKHQISWSAFLLGLQRPLEVRDGLKLQQAGKLAVAFRSESTC